MLEFIKKPVQTLLCAVLIAMVSLVVTLGVPGYIAHKACVFHKVDLEKKLKKVESQSKECKLLSCLVGHLAAQDQKTREKIADQITANDGKSVLKNKLNEVNSILNCTTIAYPPSELSSLIESREKLLKAIESEKEEITLLPFYLNSQNYLWPATWICLLWLIVLFNPTILGFAENCCLSWKDVVYFLVAPVLGPLFVLLLTKLGGGISIIVAICALALLIIVRFIAYRCNKECIYFDWNFLWLLIWLLYRIPNWERNFLGKEEGRKVYAYTHPDVHLASFLWQEIVIICFCIFMIWVWKLWSDFFVRQRDKLKEDNKDDIVAAALNTKRLHNLTSIFGHWQWCSLILALGFGFFTNFYWNFVAVIGDKRYVSSAVIAHLLWGITWLIMSLPLMITWQDWEQTQKEALAFVAQKPPDADKASLTQAITQLQPFNTINLALTGIGAFVSFVSPLIKLLFEK